MERSKLGMNYIDTVRSKRMITEGSPSDPKVEVVLLATRAKVDIMAAAQLP